jgi:hypothetical protein
VPCAHVMYALFALGVVAFNPASYTPQWRNVVYVDLGQDPAFNEEALDDVFD